VQDENEPDNNKARPRIGNELIDNFMVLGDIYCKKTKKYHHFKFFSFQNGNPYLDFSI